MSQGNRMMNSGKSPRSKAFRWLALVLVIGLVVSLAITWKIRTSSRNQNQSFRLARVTRGSIQVTVSGSGTLRPARRWELTAPTSTTVRRVLVKPGEKVREGQTLAELDAEEALFKFEEARLQLEQARASLAELQDQVTSLLVAADADGWLTGLSVREGQMLPENYLLATVTSPRMEVRAYFNASQIRNISPGQTATVFFPSLLSTVTGTVKHVSQAGKPDTRGAVLYPVLVDIENPGALVAGMSAIVSVETPAGLMQSPEETKEVSNVVSQLRTKVSGTVKKLLVSEGDYVVRGQPLMELDNQSLLRQLNSQILKVEQAEHQLAEAQRTLDDCTLRAPADATVLSVNASDGDRASAGSPILVLGDISALKVAVQVDEIDASKVKPGQKASITCDALAGTQLTGAVSSVSLEGKTSGGIAVFEAEVTIEDPPDNLLPGMTCEVRIVTASSEDTLLVPVEALVPEGENYAVWVVSQAPEAGSGTRRRSNAPVAALPSQAKKVTVQVGLMNSTHAEVLSGLTENDTVLLFGGTSPETTWTWPVQVQRRFQSPGTPMVVPR